MNLRGYIRVFRQGSRGVRAGIAGNVLCGIASVGLALYAVWLTKEIIAQACEGRVDRLAPLSMVFCVVLLGRLVASKAASRLEAWCITRFSNNMRSRCFGCVMTGSFNASGELHSADVVNRLTADVGSISSLVCSTFPAIVVSGLSFLGAFGFLMYLSPEIALVVTLLMPAAIVLGKLPVRRTHRLTKEIREQETSMYRMIQDDVSHRLLVASLGYVEKAREAFNSMQANFFRLTMRRNDLGIYAGGAVAFGFMAGYATMFLYCAYGIADGTVTVATMTALLQLVAMVQRPAVDLSHKFTPVVKAGVAIERLDELERRYRHPEAAESLVEGDGLRFENVSFRYTDGSGYVLKDFSAEIPLGKLTAIYGETGAGKTSMLRLLIGVCNPQKGRVVSPFMEPDFGRVVYVPQGNTLLSGTVMSNLLMGKPDASASEIDTALHLAAADFVKALPEGCMTPCGENGYGFSEGQAQRIAIARGVLRLMALRAQKHGAPLLFLMDEPSSALDADTESLMLQRLIPYLKGVTVVTVTHKEALKRYSDKTIILGKDI